jgi:RNA polymerase sigma factor (TIGR02999 family)
MDEPTDVDSLLARLRDGDRNAVDELLPILYAELRRIAAGYLQRERVGHTLQPTALVHEAYVGLLGQRDVEWQSRAHFLGVAARTMRRILVDHARARHADKRGGGARVNLDEGLAVANAPDVDLIALDAALRDLEALDPRLVRVVELRYFAGLTTREIAEVMGVSPATVDRERVTATAWLRNRLSGAPPESDRA